MNRLTHNFNELNARGEQALICFMTAGDPDQDTTVDLACSLYNAGVDAIELGIPFSDPLADGPSIQAASQRALDTGMTTRKAMQCAARIHDKVPGLPIVLMTYYNPVLRYGMQQFARDAAASGVDGVIITDLTPEEAAEWQEHANGSNLATIYLLAPTSTEDRVESVCKICSGFVYCVSRTGVTGARQDVPLDLQETITRIRKFTDLPLAVGFGVSLPEHVKAIGAFADGIVVGSALVDLINTNRDNPSLLKITSDYCATLKAATRKLESPHARGTR
jgi:tryptophan synthase alpha chain